MGGFSYAGCTALTKPSTASAPLAACHCTNSFAQNGRADYTERNTSLHSPPPHPTPENATRSAFPHSHGWLHVRHDGGGAFVHAAQLPAQYPRSGLLGGRTGAVAGLHRALQRTGRAARFADHGACQPGAGAGRNGSLYREPSIPGASPIVANKVSNERLDLVKNKIAAGLESASVSVVGQSNVKEKQGEIDANKLIGFIKISVTQKEITSDGKKPRKLDTIFGTSNVDMSEYNSFVNDMSNRKQKAPSESSELKKQVDHDLQLNFGDVIAPSKQTE